MHRKIGKVAPMRSSPVRKACKKDLSRSKKGKIASSQAKKSTRKTRSKLPSCINRKTAKKNFKGKASEKNVSTINSEGESSTTTVNENESSNNKLSHMYENLGSPLSSEEARIYKELHDFSYRKEYSDSENLSLPDSVSVTSNCDEILHHVKASADKMRADLLRSRADAENSLPSHSKNSDVVLPSCSKEPDIVPSCSKEPDMRPSCSKEPDMRPSCSKEPDMWPSCSKEPDMRPSCSKEPDMQPSCSKEPDMQPSCSKEPDVQSSFSKEFDIPVCSDSESPEVEKKSRPFRKFKKCSNPKTCFDMPEMKSFMKHCLQRVYEAKARREALTGPADDPDYADEYPVREFSPMERFLFSEYMSDESWAKDMEAYEAQREKDAKFVSDYLKEQEIRLKQKEEKLKRKGITKGKSSSSKHVVSSCKKVTITGNKSKKFVGESIKRNVMPPKKGSLKKPCKSQRKSKVEGASGKIKEEHIKKTMTKAKCVAKEKRSISKRGGSKVGRKAIKKKNAK